MSDDVTVPPIEVYRPPLLTMSVMNPLLYQNNINGIQYIEQYLDEYFNEDRIMDDTENITTLQQIYICIDIVEKAIDTNIFNIVDNILDRIIELIQYVRPINIYFDIETMLSHLLVHATNLRRNDMVDIMIDRYDIEYPDD